MFFCKSITVFFPVFEFGQRKLAGFHGWTVAGECRRRDGMPAGTLLKYVGAEFALMVSGGVEFSLDAAFVCSGRAAERGIVTLSPFVPALSEYDKEELSMKKLHTKAGFTLAELLIVVAIIAVLVAIAIPVFSAQLEKSREATDLANIRSAYAEVVLDAIEDNSAAKKTVTLKQQEAGWKTTDAAQTLADICGDASYVLGSGPSAAGSAEIEWVAGTSASGSGESATAAVEGHCTITLS